MKLYFFEKPISYATRTNISVGSMLLKVGQNFKLDYHFADYGIHFAIVAPS